MTTPREPLEALFETPTLAAWRAQVDAALKGADFERKLVKPTLDGVPIQPLYTEAPDAPTGLPGLAPFTRGSAAAPTVDARVLHASPGLAAEHRAILADLAKGADSIHLRVGSPNRDGLAIHRLHDFEREIDGVDLSATPMELDAGRFGVAAAALYVAAVRKAQNTRPAQGGGFGVDPLGTIAAEGARCGTLADGLARMGRLAAWTHARDFDWVWRTATVDTSAYHLAGATDAQELAYALATGVEYLRAITAHGGLDVAHANGQIAFTLSLGAEFFQQIAKLRAARRLWARVMQASGAPDQAMFLQARPADRMFTVNDPWVNLLRNTAACFAGLVGGAQVVTTLPFDHAIGQPDAMSRRIARNTLSVLRDESHLDKVLDPAGGAYFIETLTDELSQKAWALFQQIEAAGGMAQALQDGVIHTQLDESHAARLKHIAKRKQPITGVSEFPNLKEAPVERAERVPVSPDTGGSPPGAAAALDALRGAALADEFEAAIAAAAAGATLGDIQVAMEGHDHEAGAFVPQLPQRRDAAPYERLRAASEAWRQAHGDRPRVFLANLGPIAHHTGRATWAANFFGAGGIEPIATDGFADAATAAGAFAKSGAALACICSSDKVYADHAVSTAKALKAAGAQTVVLAGRPGKDEAWNEAALRAAGVDHFIYLGCDVLGTLTTLLTAQGVLK